MTRSRILSMFLTSAVLPGSLAGCGDDAAGNDGANDGTSTGAPDASETSESLSAGSADETTTGPTTGASQTEGADTTSSTGDDTGSTGGTGDESTGTTGEPTCEGAGMVEEPGGELSVDELVAAVAASTCDAIYRCCGAVDVEFYFTAFQNFTNVPQELKDQIPPSAELSAEQCPAVMEQLLEIRYLGTWMDALEAGTVQYDPAAAKECLDEMDGAGCGLGCEVNVVDVLYDGSCFGYPPPNPGPENQRRMFRRTRIEGEACARLTDGEGGLYFGTCDPTAAFCCYDDGNGGCAESPGEEGTCVAAGGEGDPCSRMGDLQLCQTGLTCSDAGMCVLEGEGEFELGEQCYDFPTYLGDCSEGYCDVLGDGSCEPLKSVGEDCVASFECRSDACIDGECALLCVGA